MNLTKRTVKPYSLSLFNRAIDQLPIVVPVVAVSFSIIIVAAISVGTFNTLPVLLLGTILSIFFVRKVTQQTSSQKLGRELIVCNALVLLFVFGWFVWSAKYSAENIFVNRDPAIYSVTAAWLVENNNLELDQERIFSNTTGVSDIGSGFQADVSDQNQVYAQGNHLLSGILALFGRLTSIEFMLKVTPIIGAAALLAFYGFVRYISQPKWALMVTVLLGLCLPFIHFARDTYTEPLALLFTMGGLSMLMIAYRANTHPLWLLAGLTVGASALTRVDGFLTVAVMIFFGFLVLTTVKTNKIKHQASFIATYLIGIFVAGFMSWYDITTLSSGYYRDLRELFVQEVALMIAAIAGGFLLVLISHKTKLIQNTYERLKPNLGRILTSAVLLLTAAMLSRPLWFESHNRSDHPFVEGMQRAAGSAVIDGSRSYGENTILWLGWYIGPVALLFALIGLCVLVNRRLAKPKTMVELYPLIVVTLGTSLVFLNDPNIIPDQIWASRRLLPVIIPGILCFCAIGLEYASERISAFIKKRSARVSSAVVYVGLAVILLATPLFIAQPFMFKKSYASQYDQIVTICNALPQEAVVVWTGRMASSALQTTETFCDKPAVLLENLTRESLSLVAQEAQQKGKRAILGITNQDRLRITDAALVDPAKLSLVSVISYETTEHTLFRPPRKMVLNERTVFLAEITNEGTLAPLSK